MAFVGRTIGSCFLLFFYIRRQKLTLTIQSIIHSFVMFLVFAIVYDVPVDVAKFLLIGCMLISGFFRAFIGIPRIIFVNACDPVRDKFELSIWLLASTVGDAIALLLVDALMKAGVESNYAFMGFILLLLLSGLLLHISVDELERPGEAVNAL